MNTFLKALSIRVFFVAIFIGALASVLLGDLWHPLRYLGIPIGFLVWIAVVIDPTTAAKCPACHKRVKVGATTCHHCSRSVTAA